MKKFLAVVLALVMVLGLAACGKTNNGGSDVVVEHTDTDTVAVGAIVLARNDVSSDAIYAFVKDIYDNAASQVDAHAKYAELSLEYASSVVGVPYHPGAAKYFEEVGYTVADVATDAGTGTAKDLRFTTGGESGTYYGFGSVLAQHATNNAGISVNAVTSGGSAANLEELAAGNAEIGFCQSDVMSYAYNGERLFDTADKSFSVVCALYMEQVQIVTVDPSIKSVADLNGKKVSIGAAGSGVYFNAVDVLEAYGLSEDSIIPTYQSFGDSADALKDGLIDAAFIVAGAPTTAVTDLATARDVYLVSLDASHISSLIASCPFYSQYTIAKNVYFAD